MGKLDGKKIAFLAADGVENSEFAQPWNAVKEAGGTPELVSLEEGEIQGVENELEKRDKFKVDKVVADADTSDYDGLVLPGGVVNPDALRANEDAVDFVRSFAEAKKPIGAICHAAQILSAAGVVKGRRINAYPACAPEVTLAGGEFVSLDFADAITDGNIVTGPAWTAHVAWLKQFLALLG